MKNLLKANKTTNNRKSKKPSPLLLRTTRNSSSKRWMDGCRCPAESPDHEFVLS